MVFRLSRLVGPMWPVRGDAPPGHWKKILNLGIVYPIIYKVLYIAGGAGFHPFEKHMSQRSKRFKTQKKKCISASNSPTRWKGQGRDASEPKKWVFGGFRVFKASVQGGNGTQLGKIFPRFLEFQVEFDWTPPQKNLWKANR